MGDVNELKPKINDLVNRIDSLEYDVDDERNELSMTKNQSDQLIKRVYNLERTTTTTNQLLRLIDRVDNLEYLERCDKIELEDLNCKVKRLSLLFFFIPLMLCFCFLKNT
jgi:hypothetical protein